MALNPPPTEQTAISTPIKQQWSTSRKYSCSPDFLSTLGFLGDVAIIMAGLSSGFWIRFRSGWITFGIDSPDMKFADYFGLICVGTVFLLSTFGFLQLYDPRNLLRHRKVTVIVFKGITFWLFAYLGLSLALKFEPSISRIYVFCSYLTTLLFLLSWRWLFDRILHAGFISKSLRQQILFVGWNEETQRLTQAIGTDPNHPYEIAGCVPSPMGGFHSPPPSDFPRLGDYRDLPQILQSQSLNIVILADLDPAMKEIVALANLCEKEFVQFKIIPSYFQILVSGLELETISGVPILGNSELPLDRLFNRFLKRCVDIVGSAVGLILSAPIIAICGLLVYLESPGRIFYRQIRTGRNGRDFQIIKLRSMRLDAEKNGAQWAQEDDPRRLRVGAFMREWNLDEVPQFWNVLKGEMSLVGPRPERPELIVTFKDQIPHYNARHASKPGITGWAQVNGLRGNTSLVERVRYDLYYLENWSLWLDFQIMFQTFIRRENAY